MCRPNLNACVSDWRCIWRVVFLSSTLCLALASNDPCRTYKVTLHGHDNDTRHRIVRGTRTWSEFTKQVLERFDVASTRGLKMEREQQCSLKILPELRQPTLRRVTHHGLRRDGITEDPGVSAWDPFLLRGGPSVRLYYLTQNVPIGRPALFWGRSWIATAISQDLREWRGLASVTFAGNGAPKWGQGERLLSPSLTASEGAIYMYLNWAKHYSRREGYVHLASSTDGVQFSIHHPPAYTPLGPKAPWLATAAPSGDVQVLAWRDPHVLHDPVSKAFFMYITASQPEQPDSKAFKLCWPDHREGHPASCFWRQYQGVVAVAASPSLTGPWRLLPPAERTMVELNVPPQYHRRWVRTKLEARAWGRPLMLLDWNSTQLGEQSGFWEKERSTVVYHGGLYHMFYQCWAEMVNPAWLMQYVFKRDLDHPNITDHMLYHHVASRPEGPFSPSPRTPVVPGSSAARLYGISMLQCTTGLCGAVAVHEAEMIVAGAYIDAPMTTQGFATLEVSGQLRLRWVDGEPEIYPALAYAN